VPNEDRLAFPLGLDLEVLIYPHVTLCDDGNEGIQIPLHVTVLKLIGIWLIPRSTSCASLGSASGGEGAVKVNKGHFDRPVESEHNIIRL
jgi:hypothetical protein